MFRGEELASQRGAGELAVASPGTGRIRVGAGGRVPWWRNYPGRASRPRLPASRPHRRDSVRLSSAGEDRRPGPRLRLFRLPAAVREKSPVWCRGHATSSGGALRRKIDRETGWLVRRNSRHRASRSKRASLRRRPDATALERQLGRCWASKSSSCPPTAAERTFLDRPLHWSGWRRPAWRRSTSAAAVGSSAALAECPSFEGRRQLTATPSPTGEAGLGGRLDRRGDRQGQHRAAKSGRRLVRGGDRRRRGGHGGNAPGLGRSVHVPSCGWRQYSEEAASWPGLAGSRAGVPVPSEPSRSSRLDGLIAAAGWGRAVPDLSDESGLFWFSIRTIGSTVGRGLGLLAWRYDALGGGRTYHNREGCGQRDIGVAAGTAGVGAAVAPAPRESRSRHARCRPARDEGCAARPVLSGGFCVFSRAFLGPGPVHRSEPGRTGGVRPPCPDETFVQDTTERQRSRWTYTISTVTGAAGRTPTKLPAGRSRSRAGSTLRRGQFGNAWKATNSGTKSVSARRSGV